MANFKATVFSNPVSWVKVALYGILLTGAYYSAFTWLVTEDWPRDDYTYCYLVPVIVLYLIWEKRKQLADIASAPSWMGMVFLGVGLILFWLGELSGEFFSLYMSFWFVLVGLCWIHLGWEKLKTIAFALFLCLAMFPLPHFLYDRVSFKLKLVSSQLGVAMMQLYGMSAYREGNVIDLGFTQLQIVDACSGLRYVIPLIVMGLLFAYFFKAAFWKRAVLVISTVPLAIVTNSIRVALTGILHEAWGPKVSEGFFHYFSGAFIFAISLAMLVGEMKVLSFRFQVLSKGHPTKRTKEQTTRVPSDHGQLQAPKTSNLKPNTNKGLKAFVQPHFLASSILLTVTLILSHGVEFREKIPIKQSFEQFPMRVGEWTGTHQTIDQRIIDELDLSDYVVVDYLNSQNKHVNLYVAYYESQRKGESIHSPATCLPGGGWDFKQAGETTVPMPGHDGGFMPVNRAVMQKVDQRQLAYYWFLQRGRVLTNAYQLKAFAFWDALTRQRTDGALVRLITPVYESEELKDAESRLQGFVRDIVPVLAEYIPGRDA
jgi:exosortase D (VPLPA-CTERM-specific)